MEGFWILKITLHLVIIIHSPKGQLHGLGQRSCPQNVIHGDQARNHVIRRLEIYITFKSTWIVAHRFRENLLIMSWVLNKEVWNDNVSDGSGLRGPHCPAASPWHGQSPCVYRPKPCSINSSYFLNFSKGSITQSDFLCLRGLALNLLECEVVHKQSVHQKWTQFWVLKSRSGSCCSRCPPMRGSPKDSVAQDSPFGLEGYLLLEHSLEALASVSLVLGWGNS